MSENNISRINLNCSWSIFQKLQVLGFFFPIEYWLRIHQNTFSRTFSKKNDNSYIFHLNIEPFYHNCKLRTVACYFIHQHLRPNYYLIDNVRQRLDHTCKNLLQKNVKYFSFHSVLWYPQKKRTLSNRNLRWYTRMDISFLEGFSLIDLQMSHPFNNTDKLTFRWILSDFILICIKIRLKHLQIKFLFIIMLSDVSSNDVLHQNISATIT